MGDGLPNIFYSKGNFFVYDKEDALRLRRERIIGQLIGCSPKNPRDIVNSSFPYLLNHYAISVIISHKLANFYKIVEKESCSVDANEKFFTKYLESTCETNEREFQELREQELRKRNIELTLEKIGNFDRNKLKLTIHDGPSEKFSNFHRIRLAQDNVRSLLKIKAHKSMVFNDLYNHGFYVGSGLKFGSDFLVYQGDPVGYHAQYCVRIVPDKDGSVDTNKISYHEINCLNRLCHTANKIMVLAIADDLSNNHDKVKYLTVKSREALEADCDDSKFEMIDLVKYTDDPMKNAKDLTNTEAELLDNKMRKV